MSCGCLHPICVKGQYVPCGKCPNCRSKQRYDLSSRIYLETAFSASSYFITLTYDEDNLPRLCSGRLGFDKKQVQDFLKRFRRYIEPIQLRYFLTCEFGDGKEAQEYLQQYGQEYGRSHYHAIFIFNSKLSLRSCRDFLQRAWPFGRVQADTCNIGRIQYATQYALKDEEYFYKEYEKGDASKPFRLFSLRPGLGAGFGNDEKPIIKYLEGYIVNDGLHPRDRIRIDGQLRGVPRYYRTVRIDHDTGERRSKLPADVIEFLSGNAQRWLSDNQESMQRSKEEHSIKEIDPLTGDCNYVNDYSWDQQIIAKRKAIRKCRKLRNK